MIAGRDRSKDEKGFRENMKLQIAGVKGWERENENRHYSFLYFGEQVKGYAVKIWFENKLLKLSYLSFITKQ